jgi:hypothetical protein
VVRLYQASCGQGYYVQQWGGDVNQTGGHSLRAPLLNRLEGRKTGGGWGKIRDRRVQERPRGRGERGGDRQKGVTKDRRERLD